MSTLTPVPALTGRDRALLAAARDGRCDLALTVVPDVRVDGLWFCDQPRASALVAAGLLARGGAVPGASRARARLTAAGRAALGAVAQAAA
ncbi:hypothetical protein ACVGOW_24425 [Pseudonocardia saturnea]